MHSEGHNWGVVEASSRNKNFWNWITIVSIIIYYMLLFFRQLYYVCQYPKLYPSHITNNSYLKTIVTAFYYFWCCREGFSRLWACIASISLHLSMLVDSNVTLIEKTSTGKACCPIKRLCALHSSVFFLPVTASPDLTCLYQ